MKCDPLESTGTMDKADERQAQIRAQLEVALQNDGLSNATRSKLQAMKDRLDKELEDKQRAGLPSRARRRPSFLACKREQAMMDMARRGIEAEGDGVQQGGAMAEADRDPEAAEAEAEAEETAGEEEESKEVMGWCQVFTLFDEGGDGMVSTAREGEDRD